MNQEEKNRLREQLKQVEKELLEKHPNWTQERARYCAMRLLCLIL